MITRDIETEFVDLFASEGIGLVPWSPLAGGFLTGKYRRGHRPSATEGRLGSQPDTDEEAWANRQDERSWSIAQAVGEVAAEHGVRSAEVALAWVLKQPTVASVIIGARTVEQLESNLRASRLELDEGAVARLDTASSIPPTYPRRFVDSYGQR